MTANDFEYFDAPFAAMAHRGGYDDKVPAPLENSLLAFVHAVDDLGFTYVETDVHATADGVLVAFHDDRLDRVTNLAGKISQLPWSVVRQARIAGSEPIPTMDEVFDALPTARINIDIKEAGAIRPLVAAIERHHAAHRVCVASFSPRRLAAFQALTGGRIATAASLDSVARAAYVPGLLVRHGLTSQAFQIPRTQNIGRIHLPVLTQGLKRVAREQGMRIHVWTIDEADDMESLISAHVDGIVSNRIHTLRRVTRMRGIW